MNQITIYGKPSSTYTYMKMVIDKTANLAGLDLEVNEVTDTKEFIKNNIMSIPAFRINGTIEERGTQNINQFLRNLMVSILKKENYGTMKIIYVPFDFSSTSENALAFAVELSKRKSALVKLFHVYHPNPVQQEGGTLHIDSNDTIAHKLDKRVQDLNNKWIGDFQSSLIDYEIVNGLAGDEIIERSSEQKQPWIVMGSSESSKPLQYLFGSVTTHVAKSSRCPVFVVPPNISFSPFKKIAFCVSDEKLDTKALDELVEVANEFNSEIHFIHVLEGKSNYSKFNFIEEFKKNNPDLNTRFEVLFGEDKLTAISDYCESRQIDLLSMTRQKTGFIKHFFKRSLTKKLAIQSTLPLLIFHK